MAETTSDSAWRPPDWFIRLCRWPWRTPGFIFGNVGLNIALGILVSLLFIHQTDLKGTQFEWLFQNRWWILGGVLIWFFITFIISGLFTLIPLRGQDTKRIDKDIQRRYLNQIRQDTELLTLKGIPAGLISESVRLDEVFIPLEFRPNRPRTDYPLTQKELETYRELRRCGKISPEQEYVLIDAENNWQHILRQSDRMSIADLWQRLTNNEPAAVIQGAPGMGKSTLMERLTLHMARRNLKQSDPDMPESERLQPPLIIAIG